LGGFPVGDLNWFPTQIASWTAQESSELAQIQNVLNNGTTTITPTAPINLTANPGNGQVTLKWNKNTESDFLNYRIYRGTSPSPTVVSDSTTAGISDTSKVITGLNNGTTYYFRVTAMNTARMESGFSNEVSASPTAGILPPSAPSSVQIAPSGWTNQNTFNITWTNPSDPFGITKVWYIIDTIPNVTSPGKAVVTSTQTLQLTI